MGWHVVTCELTQVLPFLLQTPVSMPANPELEGKSQDGKDRASAKKSKANSGNAGLAGGKTGESGKATSGSGNDGASQRCSNFRIFLLTSFRSMPSFGFLSVRFFCVNISSYPIFDGYIVLTVVPRAHQMQVTITNRYLFIRQFLYVIFSILYLQPNG